jgi:hypothetical protein
MLKLPPPIWGLAYVLIAAAISYVAGWPRVPGVPGVAFAILLIVVGNRAVRHRRRAFSAPGHRDKPNLEGKPQTRQFRAL